MYRSHNNGELKIQDVDKQVVLSGWVQRKRDQGFITWIDLRDRYGITQLVVDHSRTKADVLDQVKQLHREFVIRVGGTVIERESKNPELPTGEIEIDVQKIDILNPSKTPPFTLEEKTDGGDDLRLQYRYLDLRRKPLQDKIIFRSKVNLAVRNYLADQGFIDIETPYLIKSTPEGARDFVVPSRMHEGQFYALPQSPQTFKQLLMISGFERYFQIVKCFRDEDLRADRQPEFTQIDCEMAFVDQNDVLSTFEGLTQHLLKTFHDVDIDQFPVMSYKEAIRTYGNDKPDIRFGMKFAELNEVAQHKDFKVFNDAELVVGIAVPGCADYSRKQLDALVKWVQRPQVGAKGMVYVKCNQDGSFKSSVDKFYDEQDFKAWAEKTGAQPGDLICILSGKASDTRSQLSALRMEMAERLELRDPSEFAPLWVTDFPLFEKDEESGQLHAMHHPFTSPKQEDINLLETAPEKVRANAYDLVLNGNEIGGGSIRIHEKEMQQKMLSLLGFSEDEARKQFGFLMDAFEYGAPPHGGIAFGLDRLVAILGGQESIRDFIAFPKNNAGRDLMIDAPSTIDDEQLKELSLAINRQKND
ncbi:MAG: aspartate--tRNA ligase [Psychroflexus sp.]|nr:aspartate--tRNA ligase [Psychroflexus sp.]MDR9449413.1 aspartate--tRNA ligase [Psychroflexus sp.]